MSLIDQKKYLFALILPFLTGCMAGSDYRAPILSAPASWQTEVPSLKQAPLESARLAEWWRTLHDPLLSSLVTEAIANNLDLKLAYARLQEARARRGLSGADRLPSVTAGAGVNHNRSSAEMGAGSSRTANTYSTQLDASWELDLFGGKRRALEAATATLEASQENMRDVQVSLLAEVVLAYIEIRSDQAQLANTRVTITTLEEAARIAGWRNQAGLVSQLDVEQAALNLGQTRAQIPVLLTSLEQAKNNLALLVGRRSGALTELQAEAPIPAVNAELAVGVPAEILRRRPDVRRAERQLAAATAQVGEAEAGRYPDLTLSGTLGLQAAAPANLLNPGAFVYALAANSAMTIFDGGRLKQRVDIQNTLREQMLISYRSVVQSALRDVENALVAYAGEQNRRKSLQDAVQSAQHVVVLANSQYAAGLIDFSTVLDSQRSLLSLQDQLIRSEAAVVSDIARLYKTLGGGWDNSVQQAVASPVAPSGEKL